VRVAKPQEAAQVPAGTVPQPLPELVPSSTIYDQPTRDMSPSEVKNGQQDLEKTQPYSAEEMVVNMPTIERYVGPNLSLLVGTRTNPAIKRQHKPNEDSLFAAQGERVHNSQTQQFGLFVVADGMGGHANGQDASRLAIQTISEEALPKISGNEPLNDEMLVQILVDGVNAGVKRLDIVTGTLHEAFRGKELIFRIADRPRDSVRSHARIVDAGVFERR